MSDPITTAVRRSSLPEAGSTLGGLSLSQGAPGLRLILRGAEAAEAAGSAFGAALPRRPNRASIAGDRAALWLGPDEWLLLAPEKDRALQAELGEALAATPHALVDVSHRQTAIRVAGAGVEALLNAFVPLELTEAAFPVGMATRTIFEKAEIVLWRTAADAFHIEVWRSFAPYVWNLLEAVRRENQFGGA